MKTSYFAGYYGPGAIAISTGYPRFREPGIPRYIELGPDRSWLKLSVPEYNIRFDARLAALDPQTCWDDLHALVSVEPVLLCYEKPGELCHRRYVAEWFERHLLMVVPEAPPWPKHHDPTQRSLL